MAMDMSGRVVTGWYVELHQPRLDGHDKVTGYDIVPSIFNDEERSNGGYWHTIDADTLQEIPDLFNSL